MSDKSTLLAMIISSSLIALVLCLAEGMSPVSAGLWTALVGPSVGATLFNIVNMAGGRV